MHKISFLNHLRTVSVICALSLVTAQAMADEKEKNAKEMPKIGANAQTFDLANGLKVIVIPDHRAPVVTHMIWYNVGSADEPASQSGVAHFLEHLMFKGTKNHPGDAFSKTIAERGGVENAFTSRDFTAYYQNIAKQHLGLMMDYESDRMTNLILNDKVVAPERDVVLEERRLRIENDPASQLDEAMNAMLFVNHPYGDPVIGWNHEIHDLNKDKAIAFYDRFYTPANAVVVIAGDVTTGEVKKLAEKTYGKIKQRAEISPRIRPQVAPLHVTRKIIKRDERVTQPSLHREYLVPSYTTANDNEANALVILADILGGGKTSRLYQDLVVQRKIATSVNLWYGGSALNKTTLAIVATPAAGVSLEALEAGIDDVLTKIVSDGISDEEVEQAKHKMIADTIYAQDNQKSLANAFGSTLTTGGTIEDVQNWPSAINSVTKQQVLDVAQKYLKADQAVTGYLLGSEEKKL